MTEPNTPTNDDILAVNKALNEAPVPANNRWGINERGETVQITDEYGEPVASSAPNTDTLDEQIDKWWDNFNVGKLPSRCKEELLALFTEHSKDKSYWAGYKQATQEYERKITSIRIRSIKPKRVICGICSKLQDEITPTQLSKRNK